MVRAVSGDCCSPNGLAVYYRMSLTMRQLAPLFGVSPVTVYRVIQWPACCSP